MPISKGVNKRVAYKKESGGWGVAAGASGAKVLRRVTSNFNLNKDVYESNEIRTDYQISDLRHGVRSVEGSLNGEFSPGSYSDFIGSVLAKDFVTAPTATGLTVTTASVAGGLYTVTRSAGSWLTDGFEVGNIVRLSGGTLDTNTVGNNLLVVSMTATVLTVRVLNGSALVAQSAIASVTATATGKKSFAPLTGHTDDSYTVEEWYSDIAQSEQFTGVKVGSAAFQLPSTGLATIDFGFHGKDIATSTSQYFTSPTAAGSTGIFAAVNGAVVVNGTPVAVITSADLTIERALEAAVVVGSNTAADMFTGRIRVNGNISVYFQDGVFRDYFVNESEVSLVFALSSDNTKSSNAVSFVLPRVKLGSNTKDDSEGGVISQHSFVALLNSVTTAGLPATTIQIQDTAA